MLKQIGSRQVNFWPAAISQIVVLLGILTVLLPNLGVPSTAPDWQVFYAATQEVFKGDGPYVSQFFDSAYLVYFLAPFALLGKSAGYVVFMFFSLLVIAYTAHEMLNKKTALTMLPIFFSWFTLQFVVYGQVTAFEIATILFVYKALKKECPHYLGLAAVTAFAVPPNMLPLFLWAVVRSLIRWDARKLLKAAVIPLSIVAVSFLHFGYWPIEMWSSIQNEPPYEGWNISIYRVTEVLGLISFPLIVIAVVALILIAIYVRKRSRFGLLEEMTLILLGSIVLSPYLTNYRIFALYFMASVLVSNQGKWLKLALWGVNFVALTGAGAIPELSWKAYFATWAIGLIVFASVYILGEVKIPKFERT